MKGEKCDLKEDKPTRMWKIISPAIIYYFIRMAVEMLFGLSGIYMEFRETYRRYGVISETAYFVENLQRKIGDYSDYTIFLSALLALIYFGYNMKREKTGIVKRLKSKINVQYLISCIIFAVSLAAIISTFLSILPTDEMFGKYGISDGTILSDSIVFRLITIAVMVPVVEEIIYRGLIYTRIRNEYRAYIAMIVSSLIFAVFTFSIKQGIYAFIMGMAYSLCNELSDDIRYPVFMHAVVNACFVLVGYYRTDGIYDSIFMTVIMSVVELAALLLALGVILKMDEKRG